MDQHAQRLLDELQREGILLQHDQVLPSASAVVAGEPVTGSWWAHPMAHPIYDALNAVEDAGQAARVKLVAGKVTLVARRMWPALLAAATEGAAWQTDRLQSAERRLLTAIESATEPTRLDPTTRDAGRRLEASLLVFTDELHLPSGRHAKALVSWERWATEAGVDTTTTAADGRAAIEAIVTSWGSTRWLLPWPRA